MQDPLDLRVVMDTDQLTQEQFSRQTLVGKAGHVDAIIAVEDGIQVIILLRPNVANEIKIHIHYVWHTVAKYHMSDLVVGIYVFFRNHKSNLV